MLPSQGTDSIVRIYSRRRKVLPVLSGSLEIDQGRVEQDHIATFVHDRGVAGGTPDLARQLVDIGLLAAVIPYQIMMTMGEIDVLLVEDGGPLKWCSYNL